MMSGTVDLVNISRSNESIVNKLPHKSVEGLSSTDNTISSKDIKKSLNKAYVELRRLKKEAHKHQNFTKPQTCGKHSSKAKKCGSVSDVPKSIDVQSDDVFSDETLTQSSSKEDTEVRDNHREIINKPAIPMLNIEDPDDFSTRDDWDRSVFRDSVEESDCDEASQPTCAIFYRARGRDISTWLYDEVFFRTLSYLMVIPREVQHSDFFSLHRGHCTQTKFLSLFTVANTSTFSNEWLQHNCFTHYRFVKYNREIFEQMVRDYCGHIPTPDLHSNMLSKFLQLNAHVPIEELQLTVDVAYQYIDFSAFRAACIYGVTKSRVPRMTYV